MKNYIKEIGLNSLLSISIVINVTITLTYILTEASSRQVYEIAKDLGSFIGSIIGIAGVYGAAIYSIHHEKSQKQKESAQRLNYIIEDIRKDYDERSYKCESDIFQLETLLTGNITLEKIEQYYLYCSNHLYFDRPMEYFSAIEPQIAILGNDIFRSLHELRRYLHSIESDNYQTHADLQNIELLTSQLKGRIKKMKRCIEMIDKLKGLIAHHMS